MSIPPAVLVVSLVVGIPLMLLALGVLYHAYILGRQPLDLLEGHVDTLATESAEELLVALQDAVDDMQSQLVSQRETLAGMLSDQRPALAFAGNARHTEQPRAAGDFIPQLTEVSQEESRSGSVRSMRGGSDIRSRIAALAEDGLSDRAIARELQVGLEEVRIARMSGTRSDRGLS